MKKIGITVAGCLVVLAFGAYQYNDNDESDLNVKVDTIASSQKIIPIASDESTSSSTPHPSTDEKRSISPQESEPDQKSTIKQEQRGNVEAFYSLLSSNIVASGFSQNLANCIENALMGNLSAQSPKSLDLIIQECGNENTLNSEMQNKVKDIFTATIKAAQNPIDIRNWHDCVKKIKVSGSSCVNNIIQQAGLDMLQSTTTDGETLPAQEYFQKFASIREAAYKKVAKDCPETDLQSFSEAKFDACTK